MSAPKLSSPGLDRYGQPIVPFVLHNPLTWDVKHRFAGMGFLAGLFAHYCSMYVYRRPFYANLPWLIGGTLSGSAIGYFAGVWFRWTITSRDQVIDHYVELHPDDFNAFDAPKRQYKDILLPWNPNRNFERPIPWMKRCEWSDGTEIENIE
uniref:NADH dehydrogenase [ubiquinone] 1 subunit C2 n=1 Tax=Romanomermis culicivorax TaxID=13658 RepID=A0A915JEM6_ROMCU